MNKRTFFFGIFVALLLLVLAGGALAQSDAPLAFDISWFSIDGGGGASSGGSYTISGGFWAGGGPTQQRVYLPWVKR
jgi:hypothetical protein